jgi:hypothetical protein
LSSSARPLTTDIYWKIQKIARRLKIAALENRQNALKYVEGSTFWILATQLLARIRRANTQSKRKRMLFQHPVRTEPAQADSEQAQPETAHVKIQRPKFRQYFRKHGEICMQSDRGASD